jgi:nucleoid DNA-binding protein
MTKQEIIDRLENLTWLMAEVENTFVKNQLEAITEALKTEFNYSDEYEVQVKQVLNYDENIKNLNSLFNL